MPERARRGDDRVRQPQRPERRRSRSTAGELRPPAHRGRSHLEPELAVGVVLLQRPHRRARARPPRRCRPPRPRAAATVVMHATPWTIAARRMCMPSARGPRPRGVLTTRSTLPDEIRSTASTPTSSPTLATIVSTRTPLLSSSAGGRRRSPRSRSRARRSAGPRARPASLSRSASERNTVPLSRQLVARAGLALRERHAERAVDAHDLAGRAHLGPEDRVDVGEAVERQHGFLHRDVAAGGGRPQQPFGARARRASRRP